jgi:hypothetical protein
VGVARVAELQRLVPVVAYRLVGQHQPKASLTCWGAVAAGLGGKDWRELTVATRTRLREQMGEEEDEY